MFVNCQNSSNMGFALAKRYIWFRKNPGDLNETYNNEGMQLRVIPLSSVSEEICRAFVLIVIVLKVTHHSDYLCKSSLMHALFNDLLNVKSTVRVWFFCHYWFICSTPSFHGHRLKNIRSLFRVLSFKWGLLSSAIICRGCNCMYSGWEWISEQEELKDLLSWS